jgi:EAL domain-containing protein (putative c-di-GMP-specific phosphodiesterase class I)
VADDEPDIRSLYAHRLQTAGYEVSEAPDGATAVELLERRAFDVILSDIRMPGLDGVQLLRRVRERDLDVPVVLNTASPEAATAIEAVEFGALKYLVKPVSQAALLKTVEDAVRLHRLAQLKREAVALLGVEEKLLGDRASIEARFERALTGLFVVYQPIVDADSGRIFACEGLVRTSEPTLRSPEALLGAAERLSMLPRLGRAIRQNIRAALSECPAGTKVFVNLHPIDLNDEALYSFEEPLASHANDVVLEVTERASIHDTTDLRARITRLRERGFRIAIDDLGAGYAGLAAFAALEPEIVKLDMSLVRGLDTSPLKRKLVASMACLCRELGMHVVAEGIETEEERAAVVEAGCDLLQGYLIGRPAPDLAARL